MNDQQNNDIANLTVYTDVLTVLRERGYSEEEANQTLLDLIAQAETEVVEEVMMKLDDEQLAKLQDLPENASGDDIADLLQLNGEEIDKIRAEKVAELVAELSSVVDKDDDQIEN